MEKKRIRFIKKEHLQKTQRFYEKYGGKTIILARFVPIVRTFAPFIAGIGRMSYPRFALFNVVGAVAWVCICTLAGFFFGEMVDGWGLMVEYDVSLVGMLLGLGLCGCE